MLNLEFSELMIFNAEGFGDLGFLEFFWFGFYLFIYLFI